MSSPSRFVFSAASKNINFIFLILSLSLIFSPLIKIEHFTYDYVFTKWAINYTAMGLIILMINIHFKRFYIPKLSTGIRACLGGLFLLMLFNHYRSHLSLLSSPFIDRLLFVGFVLSFYTVVKSNKSTLPVFYGALFIGVLLFLGQVFPNLIGFALGIEPEGLPTLHKNFGNINMSAEYVGFCLAFILPMASAYKKWVPNVIVEGVIIVGVTYCYYSSCRSAVVGLGLIYAWLCFSKSMTKRDVLVYLGGPIILIVGLTLLKSCFSGMILHPTGSVDLIKSSSATCRWSMIMATLNMIVDHPLGIGPAHYFFSYIPYLSYTPQFGEQLLPETPHNEFLRVMAEDGIPFALLLGVLGILAVKSKWGLLKNCTKNHPDVIPFLLFLLSKCLFQFPFFNGVSFFLIACYGGYLLSVLYPSFSPEDILNVGKQKIRIAGSVVFLIIGLGFITSEVFSFRYAGHITLSKMACYLKGNNTLAYLNWARAEKNAGNFKEAEIILTGELHKQPYNFLALSALSSLYWEQQDRLKSCKILQEIDSLFLGQSTNHLFIKENCQSLKLKVS